MSKRRIAASTSLNINANSVRRGIRKVVEDSNSVVDIGVEAEDFVLNLLKSCPPKYSQFRGGKYLHVSDLINTCIRKIAISEKFKTTISPQQLSDSQQITFAQGSTIGDFVVNRIVDGHPGKAWGRWACSNCDAWTTVSGLKPSSCEKCLSSSFTYKEHTVCNEEYLIVGNIDLITYLPAQRALYITELKSIKKDAWDELIRPQPTHILQVLFYWWMMWKSGHRVANRASILYTAKDFMFKLPYKEFSFSPQESLSRIDSYLEDAMNRKLSLSGGELPRRILCSSKSCTEAKNCNFVDICFEEK